MFIILCCFLSINTCPASSNGGDVIVVDDENDGDYTSIKDAIAHANPGDTIKVYSGTYLEQGIHIVKDNITLLGIAYELGKGDDTGKPFIKGNGTESVIHIEASNVIVTNFHIENPWSQVKFACCIYIKVDYYPFIPRNVTISDCNISKSPHTGIYMYEPYSENITIINNNISHCNKKGIEIHSQSCIITGNIVTECGEIGILFWSILRNISGNRIRRCGIGIQFGGENNIVYRNDIESCDIGMQGGGNGTIITKNNFKNYSEIGIWFAETVGQQLYGYKKSRWIGNYWDTWIGIGPKIITGMKVLWIRRLFFLIPWIDFDWNPAKEPYEI
jgi:parallel beta-helix repeat protein